MQIRVKNVSKGSRGLYVNGDLVFVGGNSTGTFIGASADERDAAAEAEGLKVQSRISENADWTDHFKEEMPEERPWLAVATDANGSNFKPLVDFDGVWYVGTAVAGERPDTAAGYTWAKVGGSDGKNGMLSFPAEMFKGSKQVLTAVSEPITQADIDAQSSPKNKLDYAKLVEGTAPDVIAAITPENASQIGDAEEKREGGPRKGVMKAVDEAIAVG